MYRHISDPAQILTSPDFELFLSFLNPFRSSQKAHLLAQALVDMVDQAPEKDIPILYKLEPSSLKGFSMSLLLAPSVFGDKWKAGLPGDVGSQISEEYHFLVTCSFGAGMCDKVWRELLKSRLIAFEASELDACAMTASEGEGRKRI